MKLTKCDKGHFYDSDKFPECPYCNAALQTDASIVSATTGDGKAQAADTAVPTGPVTGWLVVMNGAAQGRDLRLGEGRNFLGVQADGTPVLLSADSPLSARQAVVVYDPQTAVFTLLPGTSKELCYLAGTAVLVPQSLAADAELTLGTATLRFVPFCGAFRWPMPPRKKAVPKLKPESKPESKPEFKKDPKPTANPNANGTKTNAVYKNTKAAKTTEPAKN